MSKIVYLGLDSLYSKIVGEYIETLTNNLLVKHISPKKFDQFPISYDIGIAFMYTSLVPKKELKKALWINIHPAPLPKYGGRNVAYHAIKNNETKFGSTIHLMNEKFDQGNIISTTSFDIPESATADELYNLTCADSVIHIIKNLPNILKGNIKSYKQKNPIYYPQQKINNFIDLSDEQKKTVKALYYPPHYPKIKIKDKIFNIILEEQ